jgi:diaminohydroxyphosphoribosylaminopyrimidine deaminase/5-amino-6-(5-phosphoribosylamino)uracil reductase
MTDADFLRRALEVAERGRGLTSPNPLVGAVVVRDGQIVGEGAHLRAGGPHAEVEALAAAGERARGATLYVTLEPCNHHGRTPPCAPAVARAGIARVVVALGDPNPDVAGGGASMLRQTGMTVEVGLLRDEAARQNRAWLIAMREHRPHVTLRDDPSLTVRLDAPWPREPYRVVLDTHARLSPEARLIHAGATARALVAVGPAAPPERVAALETAGATVVRGPARDGRVDISALLGVVDRVALFVAPMLVGGRSAPGVVGGEGRELKSALRLERPMVTAFGDDLLIEGDLAPRPTGG